MDNKPLQELTNFYKTMNIIYFAIIFFAEFYVICFSLRFKLDLTGYIILLTQLAIFSMRLMTDGFNNTNIKETWAQSTIIIGGYVLNEVIFFFFVFEMKYLKVRSESSSVQEYMKFKMETTIAKYSTIAALILIQLPA